MSVQASFDNDLSNDLSNDLIDDLTDNYPSCFKTIHEHGSCGVTWKLVMQDKSIRSIQEPICEMMIEKDDFDDAYNKFLITLDGSDMTSFVDFFWRRSPIDCGSLEFVDKDARMDIYDYLKDENLVPDMEKVHSEDWKFVKSTKIINPPRKIITKNKGSKTSI